MKLTDQNGDEIEVSMGKPRAFYIPEEFVFNSTDECLDKYPDQAVSVLWDMSDMKSAADKLASALRKLTNERAAAYGKMYNKHECPGAIALKEYLGENG